MSELLGRQHELTLFDDLCDEVADTGSALLVGGDPGVGKTALVDEWQRRARARGIVTIRVTGSTAESSAPFSGLHLLVQSMSGGLDALPAPQRSALDVAFGVAGGPAPSPFLLGLATLSLLSAAAAEQPTLVIAEDVHWFDVASRTALFVAARRARFDPLLIVLTHRTGHGGFDAADVGIPRLRLAPLSFIDANALLDTRADRPEGAARSTLLELAAGNPLALVELSPPPVADRGVVPLTHRLEAAFAGRYAGLPEPARLTILALALAGEGSVDDAVAAVGRALGSSVDESSRWVAAGVDAGLLTDRPSHLRFRHPLVRSAVVSATAPAERHRILRALSATVEDPERSVWWRAELTVGSDPNLATELDRLGTAAAAIGDPARAARALVRSAELTRDRTRRDDRALRAADAAIHSAAYPLAVQLLDEAIAHAESPAARFRAQWLRELVPTEPATALTRGELEPALAAIAGMSAAGDPDAALDALLHLASIAWNHAARLDRSRALTAAAAAIDLDPDDPRMLFLSALTDPVHRATEVIARITRRPDTDVSARSAWYLGYALNIAGEIDCSAQYLDRAIDGLREVGDVELLPHALMGRSWIAFLQGRFGLARDLIDECTTVALDLGDQRLKAAAAAATSWFDSLEGHTPVADSVDTVARDVLATHVLALGMADLVAGRLHDAQRHFLRLADPADPVYTLMFGVASLPNLVEVTYLTGNGHLASAQIDRVAEMAATWHAPALEAALRFARIIVIAEGGDVDGAGRMLDDDPLPVPFFDARAHLHLGGVLRRAQRNRDARAHLQNALDAFDSFPAQAWAHRCREELRASGQRTVVVSDAGTGVLTPQELRISRLAATGLTNREIAEQLFLSPRTIGAHLYTVFRKLGISNRRQLRKALAKAAAG